MGMTPRRTTHTCVHGFQAVVIPTVPIQISTNAGQRGTGSGVDCGPNAVLAFAREGYRRRDINLFDLAETLFFPGFVKLALLQLLRPPPRPDRFTDPSHRARLWPLLLDEVSPGRDDAGRVAAQDSHVDEADAGPPAIQRVLEQGESRFHDGDHHGLPGSHTFEHERHCSVEELVAPMPEQGLMAVSAVRLGLTRTEHAHARTLR